MYDLNHMGGGSSSDLLPLVSLTATCIKENSNRNQTKLVVRPSILTGQAILFIRKTKGHSRAPTSLNYGKSMDVSMER